MQKYRLIKIKFWAVPVVLLIQFSCISNKVPDNTWDMPCETDYIIITKHYKPIKLENGEIVCGELIEGIKEIRNHIETRNDTVYYDKDSRVLLHKNKDFRQRSFFNSQGQLYQRIVKWNNNITITKWNYDSYGHPATKVITDEYGIVKEKSTFIHDTNKKLIKSIHNDSISILYNYATSSSIEVITEWHYTNSIKTEKRVVVYDLSINRVISKKIEKNRDNDNVQRDSEECIDIQKWNYNPDRTCRNYYRERRDYNGKLIEKKNQQYTYNSKNDIISIESQDCFNSPIIYRQSDGSEKIDYGDNYTEQFHHSTKYIYEYKYDDRGRWIYRIIISKYNSAPYRKWNKKILQSDSLLHSQVLSNPFNIFQTYKSDTIITVREIKDIHID